MRARISFPFRAIRRAQEASDVRQAGHQLLVERAVSLPLDEEDRAEANRLASMDPGAEGAALRHLVVRCVGQLVHS